MADSTALILVAAGIAAGNEAIFAPAATGQPLWKGLNWRIVPATAVAAFACAGLEQLAPPLGKGLAGLAVLAVLIFPVGNAPSAVDNLSKMLGLTK